MSNTIQAIRGMNDILPEQIHRWQQLEAIVQEWLAAWGYREIRTPIVEQVSLFKRAIGEVTDIVEKEMYAFTDSLNGDQLALRPEGTAACVRAVIQHNLLYNATQRLWYAGPMFRHERPQKGRYRQFHQFGIEALGFADPDMDAEHIVMTADLWQRLGLHGIELEINTLGDSDARLRYRTRLIGWFEQHADLLDDDAKRRLHSNPLRILDSKNPAMQSMIEAAPKLLDDLNDRSVQHFATVQRIAGAQGVSFRINPRLVRGLDYYNDTVFEWVSHHLGAQSTVCAGGRYDGLIGQIGGKPAPACGFAMGIERLLDILDVCQVQSPVAAPDVYLVHAGEAAEQMAWGIARDLRQTGLHVIRHCGGGSFKSQMKKADASGALYACIIGDEEAATGSLTLKNLRSGAAQTTLPLTDAITRLINKERS